MNYVLRTIGEMAYGEKEAIAQVLVVFQRQDQKWLEVVDRVLTGLVRTFQRPIMRYTYSEGIDNLRTARQDQEDLATFASKMDYVLLVLSPNMTGDEHFFFPLETLNLVAKERRTRLIPLIVETTDLGTLKDILILQQLPRDKPVSQYGDIHRGTSVLSAELRGILEKALVNQEQAFKHQPIADAGPPTIHWQEEEAEGTPSFEDYFLSTKAQPFSASLLVVCDDQDRHKWEELYVHLAMLRRDGLIERISIYNSYGSNHNGSALAQALDAFDLILLLVTPHLTQSEHWFGHLAVFTATGVAGKRVIPILWQDCDMQTIQDIVRMQSLPRGAFVTSNRGADKGHHLAEIAKEIRYVLANEQSNILARKIPVVDSVFSPPPDSTPSAPQLYNDPPVYDIVIHAAPEDQAAACDLEIQLIAYQRVRGISFTVHNTHDVTPSHEPKHDQDFWFEHAKMILLIGSSEFIAGPTYHDACQIKINALPNQIVKMVLFRPVDMIESFLDFEVVPRPRQTKRSQPSQIRAVTQYVSQEDGWVDVLRDLAADLHTIAQSS